MQPIRWALLPWAEGCHHSVPFNYGPHQHGSVARVPGPSLAAALFDRSRKKKITMCSHEKSVGGNDRHCPPRNEFSAHACAQGGGVGEGGGAGVGVCVCGVGGIEKQRRQQKTSMQMHKCNACG